MSDLYVAKFRGKYLTSARTFNGQGGSYSEYDVDDDLNKALLQTKSAWEPFSPYGKRDDFEFIKAKETQARVVLLQLGASDE